MIDVNGKVLLEIAPHVSGLKAKHQKAICDALNESITSTLEKYEISTYLRIAHFLSQACHESDGFCTTEEYASGAAYEGRADLGNTQKGDGPRFKGRGLFQLTGRANYRSYGAALGRDLIADPAAAADPVNSLVIACEYWKRKALNHFADNDDIITITRRINGGLNGIESRRSYLTKAKAVLAQPQAASTRTHDATAVAVLRRGSSGEAVRELQALLVAAGYTTAIDGSFGMSAERAVMRFQAAHRLTADGIAGPETWRALHEFGQAEERTRMQSAAAMPVLRRGARGEAVRNLQTRLAAAGYPIAIDGSFGILTEQAVMRFQAAHQKTVDGVAGSVTWMALLASKQTDGAAITKIAEPVRDRSAV